MSYLAEQQIIGSLLMDKDCMANIYGLLSPEMFTDELLGRVYHEYQRAFDRGQDLTLPLLVQKISSDVFPEAVVAGSLRGCVEEVVTSAQCVQNASVLVSAYTARRATEILSSVKLSPNGIKSQIGAIISDLEGLQDNRSSSASTLAEIAAQNRDNYFREKEVAPLHIGFSKLDDLLGGLDRKSVV